VVNRKATVTDKKDLQKDGTLHENPRRKMSALLLDREVAIAYEDGMSVTRMRNNKHFGPISIISMSLCAKKSTDNKLAALISIISVI
jgi:hypothetical protein